MGDKSVANSTSVPRLEFSRKLMKYFARVDTSHVLPVQLSNGTRPYIAALVGDRVSDICKQVAFTGRSNVCVEVRGQLAILGFEPGFDPWAVVGKPVQDIHQEITMGTLMDFLTCAHDEGERVHLRVSLDEAESHVPSMKMLQFAT